MLRAPPPLPPSYRPPHFIYLLTLRLKCSPPPSNLPQHHSSEDRSVGKTRVERKPNHPTSQLPNTNRQDSKSCTHSLGHQPHPLLLLGLSVNPAPSPNPALICWRSNSSPHWSGLALSFTPSTQLRPSRRSSTAQTRRRPRGPFSVSLSPSSQHSFFLVLTAHSVLRRPALRA